MRHELNLWVAGGDLRQAKLAELLAADGHTVHTWALEGHGPLAARLPGGVYPSARPCSTEGWYRSGSSAVHSYPSGTVQVKRRNVPSSSRTGDCTRMRP